MSYAVDWEKETLKPWLETACGSQLKEAIICFAESTAQIKGVDCAQLFTDYMTCCRENEAACDPWLTYQHPALDEMEERVRVYNNTL